MPRAIAWPGPQRLLEGRAARSTTTVGNKGSPTGGHAKQAAKTTACGTPDDAGAFVVTEARVSKLKPCTRGCGRIGRPAFRAPSFLMARMRNTSSAPFLRARMRNTSSAHERWRKRTTAPPAPQTTGAMSHVWKPARISFCANGASATRAAANNRGDVACPKSVSGFWTRACAKASCLAVGAFYPPLEGEGRRECNERRGGVTHIT
jgi:hypothetical protein